MDTTVQSGKWGYRLDIQDLSGNSVLYPSADDWIFFVVADDVAEVMAAARAEIADVISAHATNLAAKFVRHGFHDCVGGCDGW